MADADVLEPPAARSPGLATAGGVLACLVLVLTIALGAFVALTSVALLATGGGELTEWSLYAAAFGLILPLSLYGGMLLAPALDRLGTLTVTAVVWSGSLLALLVLARLHYVADKDASLGSAVSVAAMLVWVAAAVGFGWLALRPSGHAVFERIGALGAPRLFAVPTALLLALLFGFSRGLGLSPGKLVLALLIAVGGLAWHLLLLRDRAPSRLSVALDVAVVVLLGLVLNDLAIHEEPQRIFGTSVDLHQNFYLGPVNDLLHGRAMLVDTFSQYGVGVFYFLAGWFQLATPGYGGLGLISGLVTAAMVAFAYGILRVGGVPRPLAVLAAAVVVLAAYFHTSGPPTSLPSTGGLRFALPYLLVLVALVVESRGERRAVLRLAVPAVVGVASVWSLETFVYCLAAFAGTSATSAAIGAGSLRAFGRRIGGQLVAAAAAVLLTQLLFAILTRVGTGQWPNWGGYFAYIGAYSVDGFGALPWPPWSSAALVGGIYLASIAGIVVPRVHAPRICSEERLALTGVAGMAMFGFAALSYFVGRSYPSVVGLVGLPCFVVVALWLGILERRRSSVPVAARIGTLSAAFVAAAMLAVFSWPVLKQRVPDTPLAVALFGGAHGSSFREGLGRMWLSKPLNERVAGARQLVGRHFPGHGPILVVAEPELTVDILVQTGRVNTLPVSHFLQDGLLLERSWPRVARAIDGLPPGTLMLTERDVLDPTPRAPTALDVLTADARVLFRRSVERIGDRFRLEVVDRASGGFLVVRLQPREEARQR